jgi:hypothetical protein
MSRKKRTVVVCHNGQAFSFTSESKSKFLAAVLTGDAAKIDWTSYANHLGSVVTGKSANATELAMALAALE